ncbi:MAG: 16S rRNA (uracil(1498)-N(3))-methyltransferase [Phycisphaerae bacterium]|nr:16S rRNA (uracil(1498)-N(3))-methyltransferase [Phycisphaerae bacterium]
MKKTSSNHLRRFFVQSLDGEAVELSADEAHHAIDVLRLKDGAEVNLFDGAGSIADGTLCLHGRKQADVHILRQREAKNRPEPLVELAFAVPKGKRLDWLLEKATELEAARLTPIIFHRSVATTAPSKRWRRTCITAAKQCGNNFLPEIAETKTLKKFLADADAEIKILGHTEGDTAIPSVLNGWSAGKEIVILIGPEGGLTDDETAAANKSGFANVGLGSLTLRIETAAIALLAAVNACCRE